MSNQPPVIPEIAKAYQNDPRTLLARAMTTAGSSGAPVAQGNLGYMDGIARVLQGLGGAYVDKKTQEKYGVDQAALLAQRKARGVDGMTGAGAPAPAVPLQPPITPTAPAGVPADPAPQASAVAAALGAPPPPQAPAGPPPGVPSAPIPPQPPGPAAGGIPAIPPAVPAQGGGPNGQLPFGQTGASVSPPAPPSNPLGAPTPEAVPNAPAPVARPVAPEAVGPTRSKLLDAAYRIMSDANPYESAAGQDLYASGLSDQDKLNEAAAERKQKLGDMGYQADLGAFNDAQNQDRQSQIADHQSAQSRNFQANQAFTQRTWEHGEHQADYANQRTLENMRASSALAVAKVKDAQTEGSTTALTDEERKALSTAVGDGRIDLKGITKFQAKVVAQSLIDNPKLDAIHLHAAATLAANPGAQQKAMLVSAMPTVLANVRDAGAKLKFSDAQFLGKMQAWGKGQFNDPDFTAYMTQRNDAMQTLAQVMSGVGATDMRTKMESDAAPKTMSPRAWSAWYSGQMDALRPRIKMYEDRGLLPSGTTSSIDPSGSPAPASGGWGKATVVGH